MKRKPYDWKEVDKDFISCEPDLGNIFSAEELGVNGDPTNVFQRKTPKTFILIRGDKKYAVNTEGYDYIRYIQRLS